MTDWRNRDAIRRQGTWVWYGRGRFHYWHGWLRPWNWIKLRRGEPNYRWRLILGPLEFRSAVNMGYPEVDDK